MRKGNQIGFQLVFMLSMTVIAVLLGVVPLFGAFVAGIVVGASSGEKVVEARETIRTFSFAFFIPLYFAMVGLRLDLVHSFSPLFFILFFTVACAGEVRERVDRRAARGRIGGRARATSRPR